MEEHGDRYLDGKRQVAGDEVSSHPLPPPSLGLSMIALGLGLGFTI